MLGPTGIGVLYGKKKELLEELEPVNLGGGMNESFRYSRYHVLQRVTN